MELDREYYKTLVKKFYNVPLSQIKTFVASEEEIEDYINLQVSNLDENDYNLAYMAFCMRICVYGMRVTDSMPVKNMILDEFNQMADVLEGFFGKVIIVRPKPLETDEGIESLKHLKLLI